MFLLKAASRLSYIHQYLSFRLTNVNDFYSWTASASLKLDILITLWHRWKELAIRAGGNNQDVRLLRAV